MLRSRTLSIPAAHETIAQSLFGLFVWAIAVVAIAPGWAPALLMFGPLVLFPLVLGHLDCAPLLRRLSTLAFLPTLVSYALDQSPAAAALALPWLAFAFALLMHRCQDELRERQFVRLLIKSYLVVGASWLVLARFGHRPLEFQHVIVHATAVHFHYAGFVLPILASLLLRANPNRRRAVLLIGLLAGMPLVATGITLAQFGVNWIETAGACAFAGVCVWFAFEQVRFGWTTRRPLLIVSSISLISAMTLATLYAVRHYWTIDWISIDFMIRSHGPIQVFGFALPGVLSWALESRRST